MSQEKLFAGLATDLYRYAMYKLGNKENAEDVVSETFVRLLQQPEQKISKPWAIGILRNVIMEKYREIAKSGFDLDETLLPGKTQHETQALDEELLKLLTAELSNLENETREVIVLKTWEELKFDEIAQVMNLNVNNVKAKYYRGIDELKMNLNTEDKKARSVALPVILLGIAQLAKAQTFAPSAEFLSVLWQQTGSGLGNLIINSNNMTSTVKGLLTRKLVWAAMTAGVVVVAATATIVIQLSKSSNVVTPGETQTPTENSPTQPDTGKPSPTQANDEEVYLLYSLADNDTISYHTISTSDTTPRPAPVTTSKRGIGSTFFDIRCDGSLIGVCDVSLYNYTTGKTSELFSVDNAGYIQAIASHPNGSVYFIVRNRASDSYARLMKWDGSISTILTWQYVIPGDGHGEIAINISATGKYILVTNTLGLNDSASESGDSLLLLNSNGNIIYKQTKKINEAKAGFLHFNAAETMAYLSLSSDSVNDKFIIQTLDLSDLSIQNGTAEFQGSYPTFSPSRSALATAIYSNGNSVKLNILNTVSGQNISIPGLGYPVWASENVLVAKPLIFPTEFPGGTELDGGIVIIRLLPGDTFTTQNLFTPVGGAAWIDATVLTKTEYDGLRK